MKRAFVLLLLFWLISFNSATFAADKVSFLYINGSNNNDKSTTSWYVNGVKKFHPTLRRKILDSEEISKFYNNGQPLNIKEEPVIFYWGDKSVDDIVFIKEQLTFSKALTSSCAFWTRKWISQCLHDAVWVQKPYNMQLVLDDMNELIKKEAKDGYDVVLYGYSAGSFIAYEYLAQRGRYIDLKSFLADTNSDSDFFNYVKEHPQENTCLAALTRDYTGLGYISREGIFHLNKDKQFIRTNYKNLPKYTEQYCAPKNTVRGAVNFASPVVLLYTDLPTIKSSTEYYHKLLIKHIYEDNLFYFTINFREDPLGSPMIKNATIAEQEQDLEIQINNPKGVIYDYSSVWSKRPFFMAHTSYWDAKVIVSNAVEKSFVDGYRFQYDEKFQNKICRKSKKKICKK